MNYIDQRAEQIYRHLWPKDEEVEEWSLYRLYALLSFAKGKATTMEDVHDAWCVWTLETNPEHRSLIPFEALEEYVQEYDRMFMEAIHACSEEI